MSSFFVKCFLVCARELRSYHSCTAYFVLCQLPFRTLKYGEALRTHKPSMSACTTAEGAGGTPQPPAISLPEAGSESSVVSKEVEGKDCAEGAGGTPQPPATSLPEAGSESSVVTKEVEGKDCAEGAGGTPQPPAISLPEAGSESSVVSKEVEGKDCAKDQSGAESNKAGKLKEERKKEDEAKELGPGRKEDGKGEDRDRERRIEHRDGGNKGRGGLMGSITRFFSREPPRDRHFYEKLTLEEKRKLYKCKSRYITLKEIETWADTRKKIVKKPKPTTDEYSHSPILDQKISLWRGDITRLEIDAIVNAANSSLLGGGGVDGAIHNAAGNSLYDECLVLNGCETGQTKITSGHRLPAKNILHTVGPMRQQRDKLEGCYKSCYELVLEHNIKSVAFCCIATGIYGYPNNEAADIALTITREWLEKNADKIDRIIFCVFLEKDYKIYRQKLFHYFPPAETRAAETRAAESGKGDESAAKEHHEKSPIPREDASAGMVDGGVDGGENKEVKNVPKISEADTTSESSPTEKEVAGSGEGNGCELKPPKNEEIVADSSEAAKPIEKPKEKEEEEKENSGSNSGGGVDQPASLSRSLTEPASKMVKNEDSTVEKDKKEEGCEDMDTSNPANDEDSSHPEKEDKENEKMDIS